MKQALDLELNDWKNAPAGVEESLPPPPIRAPPGAPAATAVIHVVDPIAEGDNGLDGLFDTVSEPPTTVQANRADFADSALPSAAASPASPQAPTSPVPSPLVHGTNVVQETTNMETGEEVQSEARSKRGRTDAASSADLREDL